MLGCREKGTLYTLGENLNSHGHCGKQYGVGAATVGDNMEVTQKIRNRAV